jgi:multimeric flavodoxin WrbA
MIWTVMKHLLIVYHLPEGKMLTMAQAVERGARHQDVSEVEVRVCLALQAEVEDLLWADALLLGTPENFGYMSGGMKDFLDRTFYPCEGKLEGLPFAMFISAGNDGTGALSAIRRIASGFSFKEAQEPVLVVGKLNDEKEQALESLGMAMAAGLELGIL